MAWTLAKQGRGGSLSHAHPKPKKGSGSERPGTATRRSPVTSATPEETSSPFGVLTTRRLHVRPFGGVSGSVDAWGF
jgi:hypothetical protein